MKKGERWDSWVVLISHHFHRLVGIKMLPTNPKKKLEKRVFLIFFWLFQLSALPQGVQRRRRRVSTDLCVVNPLALLRCTPLKQLATNYRPTGVSVTDAKGWTTHSSFGLQTTRTTRTNIFMVGNFSCHRIKWHVVVSLTGVTYLNLKPTKKSTFYLFVVCVPGEGASRRERWQEEEEANRISNEKGLCACLPPIQQPGRGGDHIQWPFSIKMKG